MEQSRWLLHLFYDVAAYIFLSACQREIAVEYDACSNAYGDFDAERQIGWRDEAFDQPRDDEQWEHAQRQRDGAP